MAQLRDKISKLGRIRDTTTPTQQDLSIDRKPLENLNTAKSYILHAGKKDLANPNQE